MLLAALEKFANILSPFRPVYSFSIAGGLLGGGVSATMGLSELLFACVLLAMWGTLFEATCALFGTGGGRRESLVRQYGGVRLWLYPPLFVALYLVLFATTYGLWRIINASVDAGLT